MLSPGVDQQAADRFLAFLADDGWDQRDRLEACFRESFFHVLAAVAVAARGQQLISVRQLCVGNLLVAEQQAADKAYTPQVMRVEPLVILRPNQQADLIEHQRQDQCRRCNGVNTPEATDRIFAQAVFLTVGDISDDVA